MANDAQHHAVSVAVASGIPPPEPQPLLRSVPDLPQLAMASTETPAEAGATPTQFPRHPGEGLLSSPPGMASEMAPPPAPTAAAAPDAAPTISLEAVFSELQSLRKQNGGSLEVPTSHPALGRIIDALTAVGIEGLVERRWERQLSALRAYRARHGNCAVPPSHPTLGAWVAEQREGYKVLEAAGGSKSGSSALTPARFERLRGLGLTVNRWERRLEELKKFKEKNGHCDVPLDYPRLGVWVLNQRDVYHFERDGMPQDRIDALEAIGFNWNRWGRNRLKVREDAWDAQYFNLLEYIKKHGHSNISQHDKDNERLGKWVKNQRYEYRKYITKGLGQSRLGRDRIDKLNQIGFQWRLRPEKIPWEERFKAIVEYKKVHGTCRVPMSYPELGKWAKYQRDQYCLFLRGKKAKISKERIEKLLSIGFEESLDEKVSQDLMGGGNAEANDEHGQNVVVKASPTAVALAGHHAPQEVVYGDPQAVAAGQAYAEQYHQGDSDQVYAVPHEVAQHQATSQNQGTHQAQPGTETFHYQHGGVHYYHA